MRCKKDRVCLDRLVALELLRYLHATSGPGDISPTGSWAFLYALEEAVKE